MGYLVDAMDEAQSAEVLARAGGQLPSGRHNLTREFVVRNQQTRIVDALAKVVACEGYAATSVQAILKEAGVSRATFYQHYESKQHCFQVALEAITDGVARRIDEAYAEGGDWVEKLHRALERFLLMLAREPDLARMCMVESISAGPDALEIYRRTIDRFESFFEDARNELPDPEQMPAYVPRAMVSGISGMIWREVNAGRAEQLPERLPDLLYYVVAPYRGREAARAAAQVGDQIA